MGMGDKKIPYVPHYDPIYDDVLQRRFSSSIMRSCPNEAVIRKYGTGGKAMVSIYVCKKCKLHTEFKMHGGIGCGLEQRVSAGKKS